jgi:hypothetical protein
MHFFCMYLHLLNTCWSKKCFEQKFWEIIRHAFACPIHFSHKYACTSNSMHTFSNLEDNEDLKAVWEVLTAIRIFSHWIYFTFYSSIKIHFQRYIKQGACVHACVFHFIVQCE